MLSFFRRFSQSKVGLIAVFIVLGVIALAFAAGDVTGLRNLGSGSKNVVATVGKREITEREVIDRIQSAMNDARRSGQNLTMAQVLAQGGPRLVLDQLINEAAFQEFAAQSGMVADRKLIEGEIAGIPGFQGPDGKFDQKRMQQVLAEQRLTLDGLRDMITRDKIGDWLSGPLRQPVQAPAQLALPYASLALERRQGTFVQIPTAAMKVGEKPSDQELLGYYNRNRTRYTLPERRIVRYAMVMPDQLRERVKPTDAEIAQAYASAGTRFAATEKRNARQLILLDQNAANQAAAQVKGGKSIEDVAKGLGLEATASGEVDKPTLARLFSPAVAEAVFAGKKGDLVGPIKTPLGWALVRVESVQKIAAKSLQQARAELSDELMQRKLATTLAQMHDQLDDGIGGGMTFDDLVARYKLQAAKTAAVTAAGINPEDPQSKPDPNLAPAIRAGFASEQGDEPQLVQAGQEGGFALVSVERIVPPTLRPFPQVHDQVLRDFVVDRGYEAARKIAVDIVAKLNRGVPMAQAIAETGLKLPKPETIETTREELRRATGANTPQQMVLMFSTPEHKAKLAPGVSRSGYMVVLVDKIVPGDARQNPGALSDVRTGLGSAFGREYFDAFSLAVRKAVNVKINEAAFKRLLDELARQGTNGG